MRDLIILTAYINVPENKFKEVSSMFSNMGENLPRDIKEKYYIVAFVFKTQAENRMECIFPKEPDTEVLSKINELIDLQNKS